ncbi:complement resistance protein TraT [Pseudodesulfovibrio sp.]|uniref:complement resistance protein TraT n=1 Tax=Pseudodesulfovibrio sp. TaxID=2035812 RepID=UPI00262719CE|nr:complement resistance protein TraT [Pseudodesulfovibrio sp.]MDD3310883.1 complement resistance protein TraT [Pseudodesulfovibrio sp.]
MRRTTTTLSLGILVFLVLLAGCTASKSRMGMVQAQDGLMYGSAMSNQFIVDSSLFVNNKIKLRIRNTSGDPSFDLYGFQRQLEDAYRGLGYEPVTTNDFGILLDINVKYSGQVQEDMRDEFRFAGGALGGVAGAYDPIREGEGRDAVAKGAAGLIVGATLGYIIGSYVTDDTYIIAADVSLATVAPREENDGTTIVFGKDEKIKRKKNNFRGFRQRETLTMAVYAGGRNVSQSEIVTGVRDRMVRILRDVI